MMDLMEKALEKEEAIKKNLAAYATIALAYSGGVDSTYLADVAHEVLGAKLLLLLSGSPSMPRSELADAERIARERGWNLTVISTDEFENDEYLKNSGDRCYVCKSRLFSLMRRYAAERGITVLAHGENADDTLDKTRLGHAAAVEQGAVAPLQEAGLTKAEIRALSQRRGLPTWDKAPQACLSSRIPIGTRIDPADVARVERAEEALKAAGFHLYRARHHGDLCRIEIMPDQMGKALEPGVREKLIAEIKAAGYRHVTLDLAGYRTAGAP